MQAEGSWEPQPVLIWWGNGKYWLTFSCFPFASPCQIFMILSFPAFPLHPLCTFSSFSFSIIFFLRLWFLHFFLLLFWYLSLFSSFFSFVNHLLVSGNTKIVKLNFKILHTCTQGGEEEKAWDRFSSVTAEHFIIFMFKTIIIHKYHLNIILPEKDFPIIFKIKSSA